MTRHYTYGAPTAGTSLYMAGARVDLADYVALCGRAVEDADYPPDPLPAERPEGVCKVCWRRAVRDHLDYGQEPPP